MSVSRLIALVASAILAVGTVAAPGAEPRATASLSRGGPDTGEGSRRDPRAAIFVRHGCTECHAISALGMKAAKDVGPDLTFAYGDVVKRYGVNLESFLYNPTGVMRLMLASHLHLGVVDRDSMLHILQALYRERRADLDDELPWLPPGLVRPRSGLTHAGLQGEPSPP